MSPPRDPGYSLLNGPFGAIQGRRLTVVRALARVALASVVVAALSPAAFAGVKTEEKTLVQFGGSWAGS